MRRNQDIAELKDGRRVNIRVGRSAHAKALKRFRNHLYAQSLHLNASAREAEETWFALRRQLSDAYRSASRLFLFAFDRSDIIAEVQLSAKPYARLLHDFHMSLGVLETHQNCGLGRFMIEAAIGWANAGAQARRISLSVHSDNAAALSLYRQCGFVEEGRRKQAIGPVNGGTDYIDEVLMARLLATDQG